MAKVIRIKNVSGTDGTWVGQTIVNGEYHDLTITEQALWGDRVEVFDAIACGELLVNKGADNVDDITNPIQGWSWLLGDTTPYSDLGNKMAVHSSTKPDVAGKEFYLVWTGSGDDISGGVIADGDKLVFDFTADSPVLTTKSLDVKFDPQYGDVYLHEGYMKYTGGTSWSAYMSALIVSEPTALQQVANLDLVVEDNWVKYSASGPGTGTHGFAATPVLIKRSFMHDGDWNYDATNGLTPNFAGTGEYKISDIERVAHKYINNIPLSGDQPVTCLTSDETAYLPPGYFIRITCDNPDQDPIKAVFYFEVYRERTAVP